MTLQEFYATTGGNYEETLSRLITEARIKKFVLRFANDPSYGELVSALEAGDVQGAFIAAHTLKGVSQNLGFDALYRASSAVTEILRAGSLGVGEEMQALKAQYAAVTGALAALEE